METAAEIFKYFRTRKGLSVKELAGELVTPQFINKYERGASDIRFENLKLLLTRMNVTMSEFIAMDETSLDGWLFQMEIELDECLHSLNSLKTKEFLKKNLDAYKDTQEKRYLFIAMIIQNFYNQSIHPIYEIDKSLLQNYLRETERWGKFEFFLLTYFANIFEPEENFQYAKELLKKEESLMEYDRFRYDLILHFIFQLIDKEYLEQAAVLFEEYFNYPNPNRRLFFIHQDLFAKYLFGLYKIKCGDPTGIADVKEIIHIFAHILNYPDYANALDVNLTYTTHGRKK